jgi:hypothetical protein
MGKAEGEPNVRGVLRGMIIVALAALFLRFGGIVEGDI